MSLESAALSRVKPSATLAADAKARELKALGRNVISLAQPLEREEKYIVK